ncbi:TM2 domain-containing protein [Sphingomonas rubra]|uniref:TM2 domain-containing protein n=1 Tax=Sphingomonas rubra TaxID=634430 RepID=A0A1I5STD1_9SPHN|nr:TM2 domain-containing protein [Sphingomonas rubra]SFP73999.1 TM2 domain-containing protein [Sphingomonas rubra]
MRGQILGVDRRTGDGLVAGDDGRRYTFRPDDWAHSGEPAIGLHVDFDPIDSRAQSIFPMPVAPGSVPAAVSPAAPTTASDRNKIIAALLAFFLGTLGIHRFYLGRNGSGIAMLVLSITIVGLLVSAPWALIDAVRYLVMPDEEFARRYAR